MSILDQPPRILNGNWPQWAQRTSIWLAKTRSVLRHRVSGESAAEDGVLLWDSSGYPVVSKGGVFIGLAVGDPLKSPVFTYTSGDLTLVTYSNGTTKALTYSSGVLTQLVTTPTAGAATTKTFNYTGGVLTSITEV